MFPLRSDGSASSLRELSFYQIRFPEPSNLLLSATHLVRLQLTSISSFRVHHIRGVSHMPLRVDQARNARHWTEIPSKSP
jgi:hypothetical protein